MFKALAVLCAAGLAASAFAQDSKPPQPPAKTPEPAAAPAAPKQPDPIPVPDGPVVERKELEGGLIVEDLTIGSGYEIKPGDAVVALYHGYLKADPAVVFDSAFNRGEPIDFALAGVIAGWQKGVPGMKIGGVRRLTVPAPLAYGANSPSPLIPANADLVFVIKIVDAVQIEDIKAGEGEEAYGICFAATAQTVYDKDGKEIERVGHDNPYIWIPGEITGSNPQQDTMQIAFKGMKIGGKRKVAIPAAFNNVSPRVRHDRPRNVPLTIEFELLAVRNLEERRDK